MGAPDVGLSRVHVLLQPEAETFEDLTRNLAAMVDRILREHGKNIIGKQFASRRLADVMIGLFVMACTLSRCSASIEAVGPEKAAAEIQMTRVLCGRVRGKAMKNFRNIDGNNDETIKEIAGVAYDRGFTLDVR